VSKKWLIVLGSFSAISFAGQVSADAANNFMTYCNSCHNMAIAPALM